MHEAEHVDAHREGLGRIVQEIFSSMLGIESEPAADEWRPRSEGLTGAIYLAGTWRGAVLLECDTRQACYFTSRLIDIPMPDAIDDDVRDAVGELANMIGGNLKSVLQGGVVLSLPTVVEGRNYSLRICGGKALMEHVAYRSPAGVFWITLVELPAEPDA